MAALTPSDVQEQILLDVGDVDPRNGDRPSKLADGIVYQRIDYLWQRYAAKDQITGGLRELYVKRDAAEMVLSVLIPRRIDVADARAGLRIRGDNIVSAYERKVDRYNAAIKALETSVGSGSQAGFRSARLRAQSPVPTYPCRPDPSAMRYGGLPGTSIRPRRTGNRRR